MNSHDARTSGLTPDEPYVPDLDDAQDQRAVLGITGADARRAGRLPAIWHPRQGVSGQSLLPPLDEEFEARLGQAEAKVDRGELLDEADLQYLSRRAAVRLLRSRRPGTVAIAVQVLTKVEETMARTRRQLEESERERAARAAPLGDI